MSNANRKARKRDHHAAVNLLEALNSDGVSTRTVRHKFATAKAKDTAYVSPRAGRERKLTGYPGYRTMKRLFVPGHGHKIQPPTTAK